MTHLRNILLCSAALAMAGCATYAEDASAPVAAAETAPSASQATEKEQAHDALFALFEKSDQEQLALSPLNAMFRGNYDNADRLGNLYSDELEAQWKAAAERNLAALAGIDRSVLSQTDQLAYDVFKLNQENVLSNYVPEILALNRVRPINHMSGLHSFYPSFESGASAAQFDTVKDFEDAMGRHGDYVRIVDRVIARFREGIGTGVLETRLTVGNMIEQLETQLATPIDESPFWTPIKNMPENIGAEDKARIIAGYRASLSEVYSANQRLRDFFADEYLPVARDSVGLSQMKGGAALYAKMIEDTTTLPLTADYLHELGLAEVARILGEMEVVKQDMGFEGSLREFFDHVRTDPKFHPPSREWLTQEYYRIGNVVDERIGALFSLLPKTPLEIRPYEPFREKFMAGGSYQSGPPDGSRPGIFYFNAYDLPSRPITQNVTLYLHEGAPGHHFQISLAQENEALPPFMRFGGNTAYVEGWALYAETLGYEMGLYQNDPIAR